MNAITKKLFLIFFLSVFGISASVADAADIKEIKAENGAAGWLAEDHSLPIIAIRISFKNSGAAYDPETKQGLSMLVASMLDEGAGALDGPRFQRELEKDAVHFSAISDYDNFHITIKTLSKNKYKALNLLRLALTQPRYDEDALKRMKSQIIAIIKKRQGEPEAVADEKLHRVFFGNHPYSHKIYGDEKSIGGIQRKDLVDFTDGNFTKNRLVISASGDLTSAEFKEMLENYLSGLKAGGEIKEIAEFENYPKKSSVTKISMNLPQSDAVFAMKCVKRSAPDYYKAYILNYIVGGGEFESRLMQEVREKRGLAYSVYTGIDPYFHAGMLQGALSTRKEKIVESLKIATSTLKKIADEGVTEEEVRDAKKNLLASLPLSLDGNEHMAEFMDIMQLYHLGIDYLDKRNKYIGSVTKDDVNKMASLLLEGNVTTVTVGK